MYSFGVVLFEILCGWLAFENRDGFLVPQAKQHYEQNTLDKIIIPDLRKQMKQNSLDTFSEIAYKCLKRDPCDHPRMVKILKELEKALEHQVSFSFFYNTSCSTRCLTLPLHLTCMF